MWLTFATVLLRGEKEFLFTARLSETPAYREARGGHTAVVPSGLAGVLSALPDQWLRPTCGSLMTH